MELNLTAQTLVYLLCATFVYNPCSFAKKIKFPRIFDLKLAQFSAPFIHNTNNHMMMKSCLYWLLCQRWIMMGSAIMAIGYDAPGLRNTKWQIFLIFSPTKFTTQESGLRGHIDSGEWVEGWPGHPIFWLSDFITFCEKGLPGLKCT